jgi:ABC-2 type transport system permease protein
MVDRARELRHELPLAWRVAAMRVRAQAHYRGSFALQMVGYMTFIALEVLGIVIFFHRFPSLGGWTLSEVLLLYALSAIVFDVADTIQNGLDLIPDQVRTGDFDKLLTRPMSIYLQGMLLDVSLRHIGKLVVSAGLLTYAWTRADPIVTGPHLALLAMSMVCGVILFVAIFSLGAIVSFWTVGSIEMVNAISYGGSDLSQYPMHIYRSWFRWIFLWIVPVGMVIYYPVLILLGKPDPLGFAPLVPVLAPLLTLGFVIAIAALWRLGLNHYHSTGS